MDNSQSSDFLSESTDIFCNSPTDPMIRENVTYDALISSTKAAFSSIRNEIRKPTFPTYFSTIIDDCRACIAQSLDLINDILLDPDVKPHNLIEYMNNAIGLLQLLSDLIKYVIETVSITCCTMKTFPTATGWIISTVFNHCKDSESVYGGHLSSVEVQLKDLFRTCHELQITYLMVMEKHFIFDLTEKEEQMILMEALDINLRIGDIVQGLDVKTMAEQWKAYTMICEKYSDHLNDKNIYDDSSRILCMMTASNLKTALEPNQDDKVIMRSLKVASFTLKILTRIFNIFKHTVNKIQEHVIEMLLFVYLNNDAYLETSYKKSAQFMNVFNNNILNSANALLGDLILDERFLNSVFTYDVHKIRSEDLLLGYIILVLNIIRIFLNHNDDSLRIQKQKIINCIYRVLPFCHIWVNMGLKFKSGGHHSIGLYELILTHAMALAVTMDPMEFNALERMMVESILSTDCYSAMFSSNLWMLLARMTGRGVLLNQVVSLCKMYQKLESNSQFTASPQQTHLAYTINKLFGTMSYEDKCKVYNTFKIFEDKNISLWIVLEISNLPKEVQNNAEEFVLGKLRVHDRKLASKGNGDIDEMIKTMKLASTCKFASDSDIEGFVLNAWSKICPKNLENIDIPEVLNKGTLWYYKYVEGLVVLTNSMENMLHNSANFVKVLHSICNIIQLGCVELKLLLINILCKLAHYETNAPKNHLVDSNPTQTFGDLFHDTNVIVNNKLFNEVKKYSRNLNGIIFSVIDIDDSLRDTWLYVTTHTLNMKYELEVKQYLRAANELAYRHKCMETGDVCSRPQTVGLQKSTSSNFEFADIDTLFETESNTEPVSKKAKLNSDGVVDEIISRLETDATSLCKIKENIMTPEYQKRIKKICNKLANILE